MANIVLMVPTGRERGKTNTILFPTITDKFDGVKQAKGVASITQEAASNDYKVTTPTSNILQASSTNQHITSIAIT